MNGCPRQNPAYGRLSLSGPGVRPGIIPAKRGIVLAVRRIRAIPLLSPIADSYLNQNLEKAINSLIFGS